MVKKKLIYRWVVLVSLTEILFPGPFYNFVTDLYFFDNDLIFNNLMPIK